MLRYFPKAPSPFLDTPQLKDKKWPQQLKTYSIFTCMCTPIFTHTPNTHTNMSHTHTHVSHTHKHVSHTQTHVISLARTHTHISHIQAHVNTQAHTHIHSQHLPLTWLAWVHPWGLWCIQCSPEQDAAAAGQLLGQRAPSWWTRRRIPAYCPGLHQDCPMTSPPLTDW